MSLCNLRCFVILLVLELAVLESQVDGFTIRRETDKSPTDLQPAESITNLEVRNDLKSNIKDMKIKNESWFQTVPIETTTTDDKIPSKIIFFTKDTSLTEAPTTISVAKTPTSKFITTPLTTTTTTATPATTITSLRITSSSTRTPEGTTTVSPTFLSSTTNPKSTTSTAVPSTTVSKPSSSTKTVTQSTTIPSIATSITSIKSTESSTYTEDESEDPTETTILKTENTITYTQGIQAENKSENVSDSSTSKPTKEVTTPSNTTVNLLNTTMQVLHKNESSVGTNSTKNNITTTAANKTLSTVINETKTKDEEWLTEVSNTSYSTETVETTDTEIDETSTSEDISSKTETTAMDVTSQASPQSTVPENDTAASEVTTRKDIKNTTEHDKPTEVLTADYSGVTVTPHWKKYTTIQRKRPTMKSDIISSTENDEALIKSGTVQSVTNISLETALNISSDIPSLEQLKKDLLAMNKIILPVISESNLTEELKPTTIIPMSPSVTEELNSSATIENVNLTETTAVFEATASPNIISSKRAGFLDFSVRPTIGTEITTVLKDVNVTMVTNNNTDTPEIRATPLLPEVQKAVSMTSQSQLAEDAINEELMKEEIISDSVENAQRQQEDRWGATTEMSNIVQLIDTSTEDKLSVRPISAEKLRNGALYTVSSNYKPLKKIDVQPPKPFVRNPDDNSWRNESLSSLGIVFKANNSSKTFTEVLKNKTETQWNNLFDKDNKGEPELRERLEKIAEMRKSKKKRINQFGETVYTDYEESNSGENSTSTKLNNSPNKQVPIKEIINYTTILPLNLKLTKKPDSMSDFEIFKKEFETTTGVAKSKKFLDDYEDDEESDYTLPNIDLKKYITPKVSASRPPPVPASTAMPTTSPSPVRTYLPERRPTLQYFPPREKPSSVNVVVNDYDTDFQRKVNAYTYDTPNKQLMDAPHTEATFRFPKNKYEQPGKTVESSRNFDVSRNIDVNKNVYLRQPESAPVPERDAAYTIVNQDGSYNKASYVIKHLRDFIDEVVKADENPAMAVTEESLRGVTASDVARQNRVKPPGDYYDYETQFRKDVLDRFVENFNQNSERFKADFPVLYNTSVVHSKQGAGPGDRPAAASNAFMKRLYEDGRAFHHAGRLPKRLEPLNPPCDRTVELSPAYELHYYVPEEEEKEEMVPKPFTTAPYRFRL